MDEELKRLLQEATETLAGAKEAAEIEALRVRYLGRKGILNRYFPLLGAEGRPAEERVRLGQRLNAFKQKLEQEIFERRQALKGQAGGAPHSEDLTLPGHPTAVGRLHPITRTIDEILSIFRSLGFSPVEGPEGETEYYNFDALNIPPEHPSRQSFDNFYLKVPPSEKGRWLLRSHTSPMQIHFMEANTPPFQILVPGRVFRRDAVDASHCFQFHQVEGLAVGLNLHFGDLKGVLVAWARGMFGPEARLRFRPHYFPFTEPSAEADLACIFCRGKGCRVCGQKGWLEILGCGMVHPAVFKAVGYPPGTVGFAFGMGVERIAMLKHGIEDIRLFFENDLRFLQQFP
ncbi:MAG: phenylalanine--tRNA ligase subunit alpha [Candidatus Omnitrophica bacterium]|nr:phenylalanine--tRNA ligase subunit alpha [Candidatus Omnitrophota bacterium]